MSKYKQENLFSAKELYPQPQPETTNSDLSDASPEKLVWDSEKQEWVGEAPPRGRRGKGYRAFKKEFERLFGKKNKRK
jgi:hypothetical protein